MSRRSRRRVQLKDEKMKKTFPEEDEDKEAVHRRGRRSVHKQKCTEKEEREDQEAGEKS